LYDNQQIYSYAMPGSYTVKVTATNILGVSAEARLEIIVKPTYDITLTLLDRDEPLEGYDVSLYYIFLPYGPPFSPSEGLEGSGTTNADGKATFTISKRFMDRMGVEVEAMLYFVIKMPDGSEVVTNRFNMDDGGITCDINPAPEPPSPFLKLISPAADEIQIGTTVQFSASTALGILTDKDEIKTWIWNFGDGSRDVVVENSSDLYDNQQIYSYAMPGSYTVKVTATNILGVSAEARLEIIVKEEPAQENIKPQIDRIEPKQGQSNIEIYIYGLNFGEKDSNSRVQFRGTAALRRFAELADATIVSWKDQSIICKVPELPEDIYDVTVANLAEISNAVKFEIVPYETGYGRQR
jgi:PKD repeat protein